jgi:hypothetical protein
VGVVADLWGPISHRPNRYEALWVLNVTACGLDSVVFDESKHVCRLSEFVTILAAINDKTRHEPLQDPAGERADLTGRFRNTLPYFCRG